MISIGITIHMDNGEGCTIVTNDGGKGLVHGLAKAVICVLNSYLIPNKYTLFLKSYGEFLPKEE